MKDRADYIRSIYAKRDKKLRKIKARRQAAAALTPVFLVCVAVCSVGFFSAGSDSAGAKAEIYNVLNDMITQSDGIRDNNVPESFYATADAYDENVRETCNTEGGGQLPGERKYLDCYYEIPQSFIDLTDAEEYKGQLSLSGKNDTMPLVEFIKHFNISRADFDKANAECGNIYNADIIYTFDNAVINDYYLR